MTGSTTVGIEATGSMQSFLELLEELGIQCRVGHPAKIRAKKPGSRSTIGGMIDLHPNPLTGSISAGILGNDQILCGNVNTARIRV
jgi:hypothetical protein